MATRKKIKTILILIIALLFLGWLFFGGRKVVAYKVKKEAALKGITVTGEVKSTADANITPEITGTIEELRPTTGEYVEEGQILAILDKDRAEAEVDAAKGKVKEARAELQNLLTEPRTEEVKRAEAKVFEEKERVRVLQQELEREQVQLDDALSEEKRFADLYDQGAVSLREYEERTLKKNELEELMDKTREEILAREAMLRQSKESLNLTLNKIKSEQIEAANARLETAEAELDVAKGNVEKHIIRAPYSGFVTKKFLVPGALTSPQTAILRLVGPGNIYLSADVEENELEFLRKGQKAYVIFDAYPGKVFEGQVYLISRQVNPLTGTFQARITKPQENIKILIGMTLDATIIVDEFQDSIIIPSDFVEEVNSNTYVYKKNGFVAKKIKVESTIFDNKRTRITEGLKEGEVILKSTDNRKLKNNMRVKVAATVEK